MDILLTLQIFFFLICSQVPEPTPDPKPFLNRKDGSETLATGNELNSETTIKNKNKNLNVLHSTIPGSIEIPKDQHNISIQTKWKFFNQFFCSHYSY